MWKFPSQVWGEPWGSTCLDMNGGGTLGDLPCLDLNGGGSPGDLPCMLNMNYNEGGTLDHVLHAPVNKL